MNDCRNCANVDNEYCFACNDGNQFKPMTNADRIRAMTDEELTKWFRSVCAPNHSCSGCKFDQLGCTFDEWLKREVDDDKSGQDQRDDG